MKAKKKKTNKAQKGNRNNTLPLRKRATTKGSIIVGTQKYNDYKVAHAIAKRAFDNGFYLEPIALYESMISDRLASRLNDLGIDTLDFGTLGLLIDAMKHEPNTKLRDLIVKDVFEWKENRNKALHEIAKREKDSTITIHEKYAACKAIAEQGKKLYAELSKQLRAVRNAAQRAKN